MVECIIRVILVFLVGVVLGPGGCARSKPVGRVPERTDPDRVSGSPQVLDVSDGFAVEEGQLPPDGGVDASQEKMKPLARVCLDPGHPSFEDDRLYEAIINRKVALYAKELLEDAGYQVLITTSDATEESLFSADYDNEGDMEQSGLEVLSMEDRAEACNAWNGEYFISIHHNRAFDTTRNITAVYFGQDAQFRPWFKDAPIWAERTVDRLYEAMETQSKKFGGDQNQLGLSLTVLEAVDVIGILTEASFYSHPEERSRLNQDPYLENEARAIVNGFIEFMNQE